jgi:PD-(D/E)XK endonuclease
MEKTQARTFPRRPATNRRQALPPKRRGEIAELAFIQKAVSLGFGVAKPWGDEDRCDYILDAGGRFWRVQVRSTAYESHRVYAVHTYVYVKRKMVALTADDID